MLSHPTIALAPLRTPSLLATYSNHAFENIGHNYGSALMPNLKRLFLLFIRGSDGEIALMERQLAMADGRVVTIRSLLKDSGKKRGEKAAIVGAIRNMDCGTAITQFMINGMNELKQMADAPDVDSCCKIASDWFTEYECKLLKLCKAGCDFDQFRVSGFTPDCATMLIDVFCPFKPDWNTATCIKALGAAKMAAVIEGPLLHLNRNLGQDATKATQFNKYVFELGQLGPKISELNMERVALALDWIRLPLCGWRKTLCNQSSFEFLFFGSIVTQTGSPNSDGDVLMYASDNSTGMSLSSHFQVEEDAKKLLEFFKKAPKKDYQLLEIQQLLDATVPVLRLKIGVNATLLSRDYAENMTKYTERYGQLLHRLGMDQSEVEAFKAVDANGDVEVDIDLTYSNTKYSLGASNTNLFRDSVQQVAEEERASVRGFFMFVSAFVKHHGICDAKSSSPDSTLSSFAWRLIAMSMCIQLDVLPALREGMLYQESMLSEGMNLTYDMIPGQTQELAQVDPSELTRYFANYMKSCVCKVSEVGTQPRRMCQVLSKCPTQATKVFQKMIDVADSSRNSDGLSDGLDGLDVNMQNLNNAKRKCNGAAQVVFVDVDGCVAGSLEFDTDGTQVTEDGASAAITKGLKFNQRSNAESVVLNEEIMQWLLEILRKRERFVTSNLKRVLWEPSAWELVIWSGRSDHLEGVIKRRMLEWFTEHGLPNAEFHILFKVAGSYQQTARWKQGVMQEFVFRSDAHVIIVDDMYPHLGGAVAGTCARSGDHAMSVTPLLFTNGKLIETSPSAFNIYSLQFTVLLDAVNIVKDRMPNVEEWNFQNPASTPINLRDARSIGATQGGSSNLLLVAPISSKLAAKLLKDVLGTLDTLKVATSKDNFQTEPPTDNTKSPVERVANHLLSLETAVFHIWHTANDCLRSPHRRSSLPVTCIDYLEIVHHDLDEAELDFGAFWRVLQRRIDSLPENPDKGQRDSDKRKVLQPAFEVVREILQQCIKWIKRSADGGTRSGANMLVRASECINLEKLPLPEMPEPDPESTASAAKEGLANALAVLLQSKIREQSASSMYEVLETVLESHQVVDQEHVLNVANTIMMHLQQVVCHNETNSDCASSLARKDTTIIELFRAIDNAQ